MKRLSKDQVEAKIKYHRKRMNYYLKKKETIEENENKIGFKF